MRHFLLLLAIFFGFLQCKNVNPQQNHYKIYFDDCKNKIDLKLSDLIYNCQIVQLETTKESIIDNKISLLVITKDIIIVGDQNGVYKFSGNGRFIKKLLNTGRGPNEISSYCKFHYYEAKKFLLIENYSLDKDRILCYDLQSECFLQPIRKCFPDYWSNFIVYHDSLIMASIEIAGFLTQDPVANPYALFIQNFKGEFISGIESSKVLIHEKYKGLFQRMSIHSGDKYVHVKNSHDDTIYNYQNDRITPYIVPDFNNGNNKPNLLPEIGTRHLGWDNFENRRFLILNLSEFAGWKNRNGFNQAVYIYNYFLFDKSDGKYAEILSYNDDLIGKKYMVESTNQQIAEFPISLPNNKLYHLYYPHDIINAKIQDNSGFSKSIIVEMNRIKSVLNETDNPILLIGEPKSRLTVLGE